MAKVEYAVGVYNPNEKVTPQLDAVIVDAGVNLPHEDELLKRFDSPVIASSLEEAARIIIENAE